MRYSSAGGLMDAAGGMIVEALGGTRMAAILTDDTVDALYSARVEQALSESGLRTCRFAMPHGEAHKTLATWEKMLAFLSEQGMTRADAVVALGGGVPGDVAGFAAACYQRGVDLVQIPTTLLAMIDSSVGGKTGVDLGGLKNQVGAFHQPRLVLIDPDALSTLPAATLSDGAAEAVKYGVLGDTELFERLSRGGWTEDAEWVIERCVFHKAALVAADELDRGSRQLLNLGHTLGHAIEKVQRFPLLARAGGGRGHDLRRAGSRGAWACAGRRWRRTSPPRSRLAACPSPRPTGRRSWPRRPWRTRSARAGKSRWSCPARSAGASSGACRRRSWRNWRAWRWGA